MKKHNCKVCNKIFYTKPYIKPLYCSRSCRNKADSINFKGIGNPFFGKKHSLKTRLKRMQKIKRFCQICNKKFLSVPSRIKIGRGKFCSRACYAQSKQQDVRGISNPNWHGGMSKLPYHFNFDEQLKLKIRERDLYTCQICNITEEEHLVLYGDALSIHHIDYNKMNCNPKNLISLCKQCNARVNFNRDYWEEYFNVRISNYYKIQKTIN